MLRSDSRTSILMNSDTDMIAMTSLMLLIYFRSIKESLQEPATPLCSLFLCLMPVYLHYQGLMNSPTDSWWAFFLEILGYVGFNIFVKRCGYDLIPKQENKTLNEGNSTRNTFNTSSAPQPQAAPQLSGRLLSQPQTPLSHQIQNGAQSQTSNQARALNQSPSLTVNVNAAIIPALYGLIYLVLVGVLFWNARVPLGFTMHLSQQPICPLTRLAVTTCSNFQSQANQSTELFEYETDIESLNIQNNEILQKKSVRMEIKR